MKNKDKILDDIARVAGGTVTAVSDLARNLREDVKSRAYEVATNLDLVPREDFERLEQVLQETRKKVDAQTKRLDSLEMALSTKKTSSTAPKAKKTTPKPNAAKKAAPTKKSKD